MYKKTKWKGEKTKEMSGGLYSEKTKKCARGNHEMEIWCSKRGVNKYKNRLKKPRIRL